MRVSPGAVTPCALCFIYALYDASPTAHRLLHFPERAPEGMSTRATDRDHLIA